MVIQQMPSADRLRNIAGFNWAGINLVAGDGFMTVSEIVVRCL